MFSYFFPSSSSGAQESTPLTGSSSREGQHQNGGGIFASTDSTYSDAKKEIAASASNTRNVLDKLFAKENIESIKETASSKFQELQESRLSLRLLALLGGLSMICVSLLGFVAHAFTLNFIGALYEIYTFILGLIVMVLEGNISRKTENSSNKLNFITDKIHKNINKYAMFTRFIWGRGILYFVAGTIQLHDQFLLEIIIGSYMCFIGCLYVVIGYRTTQKIKQQITNAGSSYTESAVKNAFNSADDDGDGMIRNEQLQTMLSTHFNIFLDEYEIETAFIYLNKDVHMDKISLEEFFNWWNDFNDNNQYEFVV